MPSCRNCLRFAGRNALGESARALRGQRPPSNPVMKNASVASAKSGIGMSGVACPSKRAARRRGMLRPWAILSESRSVQPWTEWAAKQGVSETIGTALYLLSENRKADEVVGKLTQGELEQVIEVVGHQFNCFPRGTLAALEDSRSTSPKASARSSPRASAAPLVPPNISRISRKVLTVGIASHRSPGN